MHVLENSKSIFLLWDFWGLFFFFHFRGLSHFFSVLWLNIPRTYKELRVLHEQRIDGPERLLSCCSELVTICSPKALRVAAKAPGAGPEEKKDGEKGGGNVDRWASSGTRKTSSDVPVNNQPYSSALAKGQSRCYLWSGRHGPLSL